MVVRRLLPVALLVAVAALAFPSQAAPPADAFCVILFEGFDDMRLVRITVDEETNLTQRQELFRTLDVYRDGKVDRLENDRFMRDTMEAHAGQFWNHTHGLEAWATTNGSSMARFPLHTAVWRQVGHTFHKQDHAQPWPVREAVDLETQQVRDAAFDIPDGTGSVAVHGGEPLPSTLTVAIEYVVVRAPEGWLVRSVSGYNYTGWFRLDVNATEVDVPAFDTKRPYTIQFDRREAPPSAPETVTMTQTVTATPGPDSRGSPALAPAVLAFALAAAAAVALRRRL